MSMDQQTIRRLLEEYPTPMYVFEERLLKERIRRLRSFLPEGTGLCFAVKANPFLGGFLAGCVDKFEICSPGEMYICEQQKIPAEQFVLSGVYKDEASMRYAFSHGLCEGVLTVESVSQFERIRALSMEYHTPVRVLMRLTSGSQFGMEAQEIMDLLAKYSSEIYMKCGKESGKAASSLEENGFGERCSDPDGSWKGSGTASGRWCSFEGIQFFSGTQKTSLKKHRRELAMLDDMLDRIREETGADALQLEYGPGFPAAYFEGEAFDEDAYLEEFTSLLGGMRNKVPVMLEVGRGIAASCGSLLSRVVDVKCNHNEKYAILDAGIHHLTYYGQFMAMKHPVCSIWPERETDAADPEWTLCGALCTINDLLVKKIRLHDLKCGDVMIFRNTGAYSMTEGISLFLSRDLPAVIWLEENGSTRLLRDAAPTWKLNTGYGGKH